MVSVVKRQICVISQHGDSGHARGADRSSYDQRMDPGGWQQLIDDYRDGPALIREALAGIQLSDLDVRPSSEAWTVREIVHHLADTELMAASRVRR